MLVNQHLYRKVDRLLLLYDYKAVWAMSYQNFFCNFTDVLFTNEAQRVADRFLSLCFIIYVVKLRNAVEIALLFLYLDITGIDCVGKLFSTDKKGIFTGRAYLRSKRSWFKMSLTSLISAELRSGSWKQKNKWKTNIWQWRLLMWNKSE